MKMSRTRDHLRFISTSLIYLALLSGCASTFYDDTGDHVRIRFGGGGFVDPILARYDAWSEAGKRIVVDGQVVSADAFGAFGAANICYTENVIFSPHAASYLGVVPAREATHRLAARLPDELEAWFRNDIAFYDFIGLATLDFERVYDLWPEGACDGAAENWVRRVEARRGPAQLHMAPDGR